MPGSESRALQGVASQLVVPCHEFGCRSACNRSYTIRKLQQVKYWFAESDQES